jgi:hypothetical protein
MATGGDDVAIMLAHGIDRLLTHNVADFARYDRWIGVLPLEVKE